MMRHRSKSAGQPGREALHPQAHTQITHPRNNKVPAGKNDGWQGLFLLHFAGKTETETLAFKGLICYNKIKVLVIQITKYIIKKFKYNY